MQAFRSAVEDGDIDAAIECLSPDVRFRSPAVFRPYEGKEAVGFLLRNVFEVFQDFAYDDELTDGNRSVLFFRTRVGERLLEAIDDLTVGEDGRIVDFRVMVRPLSGALALAEAMSARLSTDASD